MRPSVKGALVAAGLAVLGLPTSAFAAGQGAWSSPGQQFVQWTQQLQQAQADVQRTESQISQLTVRIQAAQQQLQAAQAKADADRQREQALKSQIGSMARHGYQTQGNQLTQLMGAQSIAELWSLLAQDRLVNDREKTLVDQLDQLRRQDEAARDQAKAHLAALQGQNAQLQAHLRAVQAQIGTLSASIAAGGTVNGNAGPVPAGTLPTTTGMAGQCTWYAEQAWVTYSDATSPGMTGDGADVVPNLARAMGAAVSMEPQPGALVSWQRSVLPGYGHVGFVASVDRDAAGNLTGWTVWEMNWQGPFRTDARHLAWTGPSGGMLFLAPPQPVDPIAKAQSLFGWNG